MQYAIQHKLPQPGMFSSVNVAYTKLLKAGTLNKPITDENVLKLVNGNKPNNIGSIKPVGSKFLVNEFPARIFTIIKIENGFVTYQSDTTGEIKPPMHAGKFQNCLKDNIISYIEGN